MVGDWVAVIYDDQWSPRTVDSVAPDTLTLEVSFMKPVADNKFIWRLGSNGKSLDTDVVPRNEVLAVLTERPIPFANRHFTFPANCARSLDELMKTV